MKWHAPNFPRLQLKNAIMRMLNVHLLSIRSWKAHQIVQLPKALGALQFFTGGRSNLCANISIKDMRSYCIYSEKICVLFISVDIGKNLSNSFS